MSSRAGIPTYRERLQLEGAVLAGCGAVVAALVLAFMDGASKGPLSTVVQEAVLVALLGSLGVGTVRRSMGKAVDLPGAVPGTGEPTPLWQLPLIVAGLTLAFGLVAGWDAGLRAAVGGALVGMAQAVLFAWVVRREEARRGVRFHRMAGSSLFTGTNLGAVPAQQR